MLIDPHIHSSGISLCSKRTPEKLIAECIVDGLDGIVLTNHCERTYPSRAGLSYKEWCQKYNGEFFKTKALGDKYGIRVFFGVEVTASYDPAVHFLIYGIQPEDFVVAPELYSLSQKELYMYCKENKFALFQAHPYRNGAVPQDPEYLDGVEINCHPGYKVTMEKELREFAASHGLRLSCGSDYHGDSYKPRKCGIIVPDGIQNETELKDYILGTQAELSIFNIVTVE